MEHPECYSDLSMPHDDRASDICYDVTVQITVIYLITYITDHFQDWFWSTKSCDVHDAVLTLMWTKVVTFGFCPKSLPWTMGMDSKPHIPRVCQHVFHGHVTSGTTSFSFSSDFHKVQTSFTVLCPFWLRAKLWKDYLVPI